MFRMSKMVGLALFGFLLVVCTISSAQPGKDKTDDPKTEKGKFDPKTKGGGFRPEPGKIFNTFVITQLKLTDEQKKQLDSMQKDVDEKIDKLLTDDQKKILKDLSNRRPMRPGMKDKDKDDKKDDKKDN